MTPTTPTENRPGREFQGPYDPANGQCAYGHPVNGDGRCEQLNIDPDATPPSCPTHAQRVAFLQGSPVADVVGTAQGLGIAIPPLLAGQALINALAPLIAAAEGLVP